MATQFKNLLLQHLDQDTLSRLHLRRIDLPVLYDLEEPGRPIQHLFFLEEGIGSMTTGFENGAQVETSMFGYESVIGISALMGAKHSFNRIFMQLSGFGYAAPVRSAQEEFRRHGEFLHLALSYVQAQLTLSTQNAACNASHTYEQRLARWLLICCDRAKQEHLEMAQEFVAQMLGSTRSTVSIAAGALKAKGLIDYHRGRYKFWMSQASRTRLVSAIAWCVSTLKTFSTSIPASPPNVSAVTDGLCDFAQTKGG